MKRNNQKNNRIPLFYFLPLIVFLESLWMGIPLLFLCGCLVVALTYEYLPVSYYLVPVLALYIVTLPFCLIKNRRFQMAKNDHRKYGFCESAVVLRESQRYAKRKNNLMDFVIRYFFFMRNSAYHKCFFHPLEQDDAFSEDYFIYINTPEKEKLLKCLYSCEKEYSSGSVLFSDDVPLKVKYGKKSHMIECISPVEGYVYSENQLYAIKQLTRLILADNGHKKKGISIMPITLMPVCLLAIIAIAVLFIEAGICFFLSLQIMKDPGPKLADIDIEYGLLLLIELLIPYVGLLFHCGIKSLSFFCLFQGRFMKCCTSDIISGSSVSLPALDGLHGSLSLLFRRKNPYFQELKFTEYDSVLRRNGNAGKTLYFIMTNEKYDALREISKCSSDRIYAGYRVGYLTRFYFQDGIPLRVVYGKRDRILREILPVDYFDYTPKQLDSIDRLNKMYP